MYCLFKTILYITDLNPVLTPEVATTYLGGNVNFTCTKADISMETAWNTKLMDLKYETRNSIDVTLNSSVDNIEYNGTSVWCFSRYPDEPGMLFVSNPGKILIQGKYGDCQYIVYVSFKGLLGLIESNITKHDSCTVKVFWDPPFTLQGVPILGYNINITNVITGEIFSTTTKYTSIQISLEYSMDITIAAVNGAGQGNISIVIIDLNEYEEGNKLSIIINYL